MYFPSGNLIRTCWRGGQPHLHCAFLISTHRTVFFKASLYCMCSSVPGLVLSILQAWDLIFTTMLWGWPPFSSGVCRDRTKLLRQVAQLDRSNRSSVWVFPAFTAFTLGHCVYSLKPFLRHCTDEVQDLLVSEGLSSFVLILSRLHVSE